MHINYFSFLAFTFQKPFEKFELESQRALGMQESISQEQIFSTHFCIFSIRFKICDIISLSPHEQIRLTCIFNNIFQVWTLIDDGRMTSRNVDSLNILVHEVITYHIMNAEETFDILKYIKICMSIAISISKTL